MSLEFAYSFEKFGLAVDDLMNPRDHIKQRLRRAFDHIGRVRERDVPEKFHKQFRSISERIRSGVPQNREGTLEATINQITEEEMNKLIDDILEFNQELIWWRRGNLERG